MTGNLHIDGRYESACRTYGSDGVSPALPTAGGGGIVPKIEVRPIVTKVRVRRHPIDQKELARYLKQAKEKCGLSVRDIAETLSIPITEAEHWFRADKCGNIPDADVWYELKELLHLDTDRWDMAVTEFDMVENEYEYAQRCYRTSGLAPALTNTEIKIEDRR